MVARYLYNLEPSEGLKIRGCQYYLVGIICSPLVEIGFIDLPKSGVPPRGAPRDDTPASQAEDLVNFYRVFLEKLNFKGLASLDQLSPPN